MTSVPTGWELEQAQARLELLDAAILSYKIAGEQDVASRLMGIRELAAAKLARLSSQ